MGYFMRFIVTDGELRLEEVEHALSAVDPPFRLQGHGESRDHSADLYRGDELYGELEVNRPGDDLFEDEIDELLELLEGQEGEAVETVETVLRGATAILAVRVLWQGREVESTLSSLDPLWRWLHDQREGLLQADDEGYYDGDGLVLAT